MELENFGSIDILFLVDIIIKREGFKRGNLSLLE